MLVVVILSSNIFRHLLLRVALMPNTVVCTNFLVYLEISSPLLCCCASLSVTTFISDNIPKSRSIAKCCLKSVFAGYVRNELQVSEGWI